jgi:hypothetical protein
VLKLLFNPNQLVNVLHQQADLNRHFVQTTTQARVDRAAWNSLYYEVLHNLVLETTRTGIELKNLKMRVEALSSRLDFSERRVRALEGVVQYRPEAVAPRERRQEPVAAGGGVEAAGVPGPAGSGAGDGSAGSADPRRRRRRRRGRRGPGIGPAAAEGANAGGDGLPEGSDGPDDLVDDGGDEGPDGAGEMADSPGRSDTDPQAS